jgi:hypothetical protein
VCERNRLRSISSRSSVAKKLSHMALSYASPSEPVDGLTPASLHRLPNASDLYWADSRCRPVGRVGPCGAVASSAADARDPRGLHEPCHARLRDGNAFGLHSACTRGAPQVPREAAWIVRMRRSRSPSAVARAEGGRLRQAWSPDAETRSTRHDMNGVVGLVRAQEPAHPDGSPCSRTRTRPPPLPRCRAPAEGGRSRDGAWSALRARRWSDRPFACRHSDPPGEPSSKLTAPPARTSATTPQACARRTNSTICRRNSGGHAVRNLPM